MNSRPHIISLLVLILSTIGVSGQIAFQKLSIQEAKEQARQQDKQILIDFRANWCKPCLAMEKTTFKDKQVGDIINQLYIPLKIDVDYFDGMDLQEEYNVSVLPTILIIDSYGAVQRRLIGEKTAKSLLNELGFEYTGKDTPIKVEDDENSESVKEPKVKKECKFRAWWRNLWS